MSRQPFLRDRVPRLFVAWALLPLLYGQAVAPAQQPAAAPGTPAAPAAQAAPAEPGPAAEYVLQAGDEMDIRVYNLPELSQKVKVRPDGRISLMLLDELIAAGATAPSLGESIRQGYSTQFRNPRVTVVVTSFMNQNVFVGGEVNQPRLIPLNGRLSAAAAVFYAGGLKSTAKTKEIIILRNSGKSAAQLTRLDLESVLNKGAPDLELRPFDVVYVPKSRIAKLDQFVDQYLKQLQPIALNLGFTYLLGGQSVVIP
jgi:protein involved in polysaccharide export with SLBB domain